jgi:hypothetical protein
MVKSLPVPPTLPETESMQVDAGLARGHGLDGPLHRDRHVHHECRLHRGKTVSGEQEMVVVVAAKYCLPLVTAPFPVACVILLPFRPL